MRGRGLKWRPRPGQLILNLLGKILRYPITVDDRRIVFLEIARSDDLL